MSKTIGLVCVICLVMAMSSVASADNFGTGLNNFTIDFVKISGDASSANGTNISRLKSYQTGYKTFSDPGGSYRMGVHEITNGQWGDFVAAVSPVAVAGAPWYAYNSDPHWTGVDVPTNNVSWHEAAQFVNWLNTSTGHQPAYKFTGTPGDDDTDPYTLGVWTAADAAGGTNLYRHKDGRIHIRSATLRLWNTSAGVL